MNIGTLRPEEARVRDSAAGFHPFHDELDVPEGSFEVFWQNAGRDEDGEPIRAGWYWWACWPGCMPEGEATGPFPSSNAALHDADGALL